MTPTRDPSSLRRLSRRDFLKLSGLTGLAALAAGCGVDRTAMATPVPAATASPTPSLAVPPAPSPTATPAWRSLVALGRADGYDPAALRTELERMFDSLGGLGGLVRPGARVGIKPNLTGETWWDAQLPVPATELFATHPAVVQALAEILLDAGAAQVTVMEGLGDALIFSRWGYVDMARPLGLSLVDLCNPAPYVSFKPFPVGPKYSVYDSFYLNGLLNELDVFISVAKMKCHVTAGVTLSMKNLFGIAPIAPYRRHADDNNRSAFHDTAAFDRRVPRVIVDLNLARPIHLAIIDGVRTAEAGAGPWDAGLSPVRPGVLVAGRDAVATDAVAAAVMGFEPAAPSGSPPFVGGENHLALANDLGLGTNRLAEIGVTGPQIDEVRFLFQPVK